VRVEAWARHAREGDMYSRGTAGELVGRKSGRPRASAPRREAPGRGSAHRQTFVFQPGRMETMSDPTPRLWFASWAQGCLRVS